MWMWKQTIYELYAYAGISEENEHLCGNVHFKCNINLTYVRQDSSQVSKTLTVNVESIYWNSIGIFM